MCCRPIPDSDLLQGQEGHSKNYVLFFECIETGIGGIPEWLDPDLCLKHRLLFGSIDSLEISDIFNAISIIVDVSERIPISAVIICFLCFSERTIGAGGLSILMRENWDCYQIIRSLIPVNLRQFIAD